MNSSHFNSDRQAHMVDVSSKKVTVRRALAAADVKLSDDAAEMIRAGSASKGDVLGIARIAAIQATKLTQQLIPLCHSIPVESVTVDFLWPESNVLQCNVTVQTSAKTGVEMEAMSGASIAALTVYDMIKSVDRTAIIGPIRLLKKSGGKSGDFVRDDS